MESDWHLLAVISALGSPGASTVTVTTAATVPGTAAAAIIMSLLAVVHLPPIRSMTRAATGFRRGSSSSDPVILVAWRHLSGLSAPLLAMAAVIFGKASLPTGATVISRLSVSSSTLAVMITVVFGWTSLPTVAADISVLSASSLFLMMISVVLDCTYMPIIAPDISMLSSASLLAMVAVVFGRASLSTVSAGLPISR